MQPYVPPDLGGGWSGYPSIIFPRADLSFENEHERLGPNKAEFTKLKLHLAEALDVHIGRQHTFADEFRNMSHKNQLLTLAVMGLIEAGPVKGLKLFGAVVYTTFKLYIKDPNMRFFTHRWLNKIKLPAAQRGGWLYAGRTTGRLDKVQPITMNPLYRTLQEGGATIFKGKGWSNRLGHLEGFDPEFEIDFDTKRRLERFLKEETDPDIEPYEEFDMPYNRRTGQWYPARRRRAYNTGRRPYRRSYGGGYAPRRRRSYRRW